MQVELKKVGKQPKQFKITKVYDKKEITFSGSFYKDSSAFIVVDALISGELLVRCDITQKKFYKPINEELKLKITDCPYKGFDDVYDIVEIFESVIDFDALMESEIESLRCDYHKSEEYLKRAQIAEFENI